MKSKCFNWLLSTTITVIIIEASRSGQNLMKRVPSVAIIVENMEGEILLLLRDNKSAIVYPNHWTLIEGKVGEGETAEMAARRQLQEETGLKADLSFWKRYDREHPLFIVDQFIFTGKVDASGGVLVLGQDIQFFKPDEVKYLKIGYGFKDLLHEYFMTPMDSLDVHHA